MALPRRDAHRERREAAKKRNDALRRVAKARTQRERAQAQGELDRADREYRQANRDWRATLRQNTEKPQGENDSLPWEVTSGYPGINMADAEVGGGWIPVFSSNVHSVQWVPGDPYPMKVRFKGKDRGVVAEYEYQATPGMYDAMLSAGSPGRLVHTVLDRVPYRRVG